MAQTLHRERDANLLPDFRGFFHSDNQPALQPDLELFALKKNILHPGADLTPGLSR